MAKLLRLIPERYERRAEGAYPWVGGAIAFAAAAWGLPRWAFTNAPALVDPVINVAAIAVAFLVAVAVMLASMKAEPVIRELQRIDAFPIMLGYIRSAIYVWMLVIVIGLLVKIIPEEAIVLGGLFAAAPDTMSELPQIRWDTFLVVAWVTALTSGALAGHRIVRLLFVLLRYRDPRLIRSAEPEDEGDDDVLRLPPERRRRAR